MKFICGPSFLEKHMTKQRWHSWFAWRPVRVASGDCRWLETVARKGHFHAFITLTSPWDWEYAALTRLPRSSRREVVEEET